MPKRAQIVPLCENIHPWDIQMYKENLMDEIERLENVLKEKKKELVQVIDVHHQVIEQYESMKENASKQINEIEKNAKREESQYSYDDSKIAELIQAKIALEKEQAEFQERLNEVKEEKKEEKILFDDSIMQILKDLEIEYDEVKDAFEALEEDQKNRSSTKRWFYDECEKMEDYLKILRELVDDRNIDLKTVEEDIEYFKGKLEELKREPVESPVMNGGSLFDVIETKRLKMYKEVCTLRTEYEGYKKGNSYLEDQLKMLNDNKELIEQLKSVSMRDLFSENEELLTDFKKILIEMDEKFEQEIKEATFTDTVDGKPSGNDILYFNYLQTLADYTISRLNDKTKELKKVETFNLSKRDMRMNILEDLYDWNEKCISLGKQLEGLKSDFEEEVKREAMEMKKIHTNSRTNSETDEATSESEQIEYDTEIDNDDTDEYSEAIKDDKNFDDIIEDGPILAHDNWPSWRYAKLKSKELERGILEHSEFCRDTRKLRYAEGTLDNEDKPKIAKSDQKKYPIIKFSSKK